MVALLHSRGYRFKVLEQSDERVTVRGTDLEGEEFVSQWTIQRAIKAGYVPEINEATGKYRTNSNGKLLGNEKYLTDPQAMLKAKAQAEVCRDMAPDVLLGISYSSEDLESERWDEGPVQVSRPAQEPVTVEEIFGETEEPAADPQPTGEEVDAEAQLAQAEAEAENEPLEAEVVADEPEEPAAAAEPETAPEPAPAPKKAPAKPKKSKMREALEKRLFGLTGDAKLTDREDRITVYRELLRETHDPDAINSTDDLSDVEVAAIADQLFKWQQENRLEDETLELLNRASYREVSEADQAHASGNE